MYTSVKKVTFVLVVLSDQTELRIQIINLYFNAMDSLIGVLSGEENEILVIL